MLIAEGATDGTGTIGISSINSNGRSGSDSWNGFASGTGGTGVALFTGAPRVAGAVLNAAAPIDAAAAVPDEPPEVGTLLLPTPPATLAAGGITWGLNGVPDDAAPMPPAGLTTGARAATFNNEAASAPEGGTALVAAGAFGTPEIDAAPVAALGAP